MRLRFTIRDLFWLTALVAMALAWWVDHRELSRPPAYTVRVTDVDFIIQDTKTGSALYRVDKKTEQLWRQRGNDWVTIGPPITRPNPNDIIRPQDMKWPAAK
jgi:hypothetical protein